MGSERDLTEITERQRDRFRITEDVGSEEPHLRGGAKGIAFPGSRGKRCRFDGELPLPPEPGDVTGHPDVRRRGQ